MIDFKDLMRKLSSNLMRVELLADEIRKMNEELVRMSKEYQSNFNYSDKHLPAHNDLVERYHFYIEQINQRKSEIIILLSETEKYSKQLVPRKSNVPLVYRRDQLMKLRHNEKMKLNPEVFIKFPELARVRLF